MPVARRGLRVLLPVTFFGGRPIMGCTRLLTQGHIGSRFCALRKASVDEATPSEDEHVAVAQMHPPRSGIRKKRVSARGSAPSPNQRSQGLNLVAKEKCVKRETAVFHGSLHQLD